MIINSLGVGKGTEEPEEWTYKDVRITPIMTGFTTPRGTVTESAHYGSSALQYYGWRAFANGQGWSLAAPGWVQYTFPDIFTKVRVKKILLHQSANYPQEIYIDIGINTVYSDENMVEVVSFTGLTRPEWTDGIIVNLDHTCRGIRITTSRAYDNYRGQIGRSVIYGDVKIAPGVDLSEETLNSGM